MMVSNQLAIDFASSPSLARGDYVTSACNILAVDQVERWPHWAGPIKGLVIHGPEGCGKSHLASIWGERVAAKTMTNLDDASLDEITAHRHVIWDNIEPSSAWPDDLIFHSLNRLIEVDGSVLILSRQPIGAVEWRLADVSSRLRGLPRAPIMPPDDDLLGALLQKHADDCGLVLDPDVAHYIIARMDRSFKAARQVITRLNKAAWAEKRRVTTPFARQVLEGDTTDF